MDSLFDRLISLYRFPSGRRLHALRQMLKVAQEMRFQQLAGLLEKAVDHEWATYKLTAEWRQARTDRTPVFGQEAQQLDRRIDRHLGAGNDILKGHQTAADPQQAQAVQELREAIFPGGVLESIRLSYVEERAELERVLELLEGKYHERVAELAMSNWAAELRNLADAFAPLVQKRKEASLDFGEVRSAQSKAQTNMLRAVAVAMGHFNGDNDEDVAARKKLLDPILKQNEEIGELRRQRRGVSDIDPETGQELPIDPGSETD